MTDPSFYRDDSRVRHMLDAMRRIVEVCADLHRGQLRPHDDKTEVILYNLMVLGEAANNISHDFAAKNPSVDWKGIAGVRHKIVHDYAGIDFDAIWDILCNDIPHEYERVREVASPLPPEPTLPPANMADFL